MVEENPDGYAVVRNGSYGSYWGPNRCGYSTSIFFAGLYPIEEAYDIVRGSDYSRQEIM